MFSTQSRLRAYLLPLLIFSLALAARLVPGPRTIDDSYITYRYARNILAGNGFVYNPGERVLGTTTPLYTFLLTGVGFIAGGTGAPLPLISLVINAIFDGLTCLILIRLGSDLEAPWAGIGAAAVWAIAPYSVTFAIGGLETSLYVLLLMGTVWAHMRNYHIPAAVLGALSLLTRPDALILLGPLALDRFAQIWPSLKRSLDHSPGQQDGSLSPQNRLSVYELLGFTLPVAIWVVFASMYFGSPLPHSIIAKNLAYLLPAEAALVRLLQHYATPFLGHLTFGLNWIKIGIWLYPFLYIIGARRILRTNKHTWHFLLYPWLYLIVFSIANPLIFRWYLTPPLPIYFFGILAGAESLIKTLLGVITRLPATTPERVFRPFSTVVLFALVLLAPVALSLKDWRILPTHGLRRPAPDMAWYQLELIYHQAAEVINSELLPADASPLLAAGDVGVLGYETGLTILDTVGLNSPVTTNYYPLDPQYYAINYAIPPDLIIDLKPDIIVILEIYGRLSLLKDSRFKVQYHLRYKIPTDIYGSDGMLIFERTPALGSNQ